MGFFRLISAPQIQARLALNQACDVRGALLPGEEWSGLVTDQGEERGVHVHGLFRCFDDPHDLIGLLGRHGPELKLHHGVLSDGDAHPALGCGDALAVFVEEMLPFSSVRYLTSMHLSKAR